MASFLKRMFESDFERDVREREERIQAAQEEEKPARDEAKRHAFWGSRNQSVVTNEDDAQEHRNKLFNFGTRQYHDRAQGKNPAERENVADSGITLHIQDELISDSGITLKIKK